MFKLYFLIFYYFNEFFKMFSQGFATVSKVHNGKVYEDNINSTPVGNLAKHGLTDIKITLEASGMRDSSNPDYTFQDSMDAGSGPTMRCPLDVLNSMNDEISSPTPDANCLIPMFFYEMPSESSLMPIKKRQVYSTKNNSKSMPLGSCPMKLMAKNLRGMKKEMHTMASMQMDPQSILMGMKNQMPLMGMNPKAMMMKPCPMMEKSQTMNSMQMDPQAMSMGMKHQMGLREKSRIEMDSKAVPMIMARVISGYTEPEIMAMVSREMQEMRMAKLPMMPLISDAPPMSMEIKKNLEKFTDVHELILSQYTIDMEPKDEIYLNLLGLMFTDMKTVKEVKMISSQKEFLKTMNGYLMMNELEVKLKKAFMKVRDLMDFIKLIETER